MSNLSTANIIGRFLITSFAVMSLLFVLACKRQSVSPANLPASSATTSPTTAQPTPTSEGRKYTGTGLVTKVVRENPYDKTIASMELNHGEIVGLMPAMRMEFVVKDKALLDGIKIGDLVDFTIEEIGPTPVIVEITKK